MRSESYEFFGIGGTRVMSTGIPEAECRRPMLSTRSSKPTAENSAEQPSKRGQASNHRSHHTLIMTPDFLSKTVQFYQKPYQQKDRNP
mmetsp:Transcript_9259/g.19233  ORF Transcript_9259/g.19233 Transcript_9259/m.19233 type:complete len:88 (+) Transcript_9259:829-1092(+)